MAVNTIDQAVREWPRTVEKADETIRAWVSLRNKLNKFYEDSDPTLPKRAGGLISRLDLPEGFPKQDIDSYTAVSHELAIKFRSAYEPFMSQGGLEIAQQKATRKAERRDQWWLWGQRLVRWVCGIIGAVLLYSTLVWLQESVAFIKLPVVDVLKAAAGG